MKKRALLLAALLALPLVSQAGIFINVTPDSAWRVGDRDHRGHYWDGHRWREARWWRAHHRDYRPPRHYRGHDRPPHRADFRQREWHHHHDHHHRG
ncbi:DUF2502 domain-containing protein [Serratia rhizosphaerae]|uniref:DUF2502 domain-containing protein n=1 Tax=unclassified Serratia (in: enterobacteria) TaxID=2647522 RepID=UPI000CF65D67|nr:MULTISPECIES: DUF2502 domain-containing protein [unclassified Serratia (in: enterobacteria)]AVJ18675.1 hypothetical protein CLM71_16840 [Serratia sp. MYb239]MCA4822562.1 DUF2502 domain-containing protein [Serratia rubidaea]CAE1148435.1 conserved exported protein of unknown function [Serratia sp. Tan611]SQJ14198.1 Protein of uncharacterised function (DUF2502) [Serratia rubidaea]